MRFSGENLLLKVSQTQHLCGFFTFLKFADKGENNNTPKYHNTIHLCCQTKINYKGLKTNLIRITKEESIEVRKKFPNVHIAITSRQKTHNRKGYYMEENRAAMGWLKKYRMKGLGKSIGRV